MAKSKKESDPYGSVVDLQLARKLAEKDPRYRGIGWMPNICKVCSGSKEHDGKVCYYCNGSGFGPQYDALIAEEFEVFFGGARGGGKALLLKDLVQTPFGEKLVKDIKIGSVVSNPDGTIATVIDIPYEGERDVYRVVFDDGASVTASDNHLWNIRLTGSKQKGNSPRYDVATTLQVRDILERAKSRKNKGNVYIPLTKPVQFTKSYKYKVRSIHPYVLGVLIGDGCLRDQVTFASIDPEIPKRVWELIDPEDGELGLVHATEVPVYTVRNRRKLREKLTKLSLWDKQAKEKHIPDCYKLGTLEDRWNLIQGLFDTDGYVDERGHLSYTTVSKHLAEDIQWVVRSLGGKATLSSKIGKYRDKYGGVKECQTAYTLYIAHPETENFFSLSRKKDRCRNNSIRNNGIREDSFYDHGRRITSIEFVGRERCKCISVSHPNGLFLTNDFIVTHNSEASRAWAVSGNPRKPWWRKKADGEIFPIPVNQSYIHHPMYRCLVLRRNQNDLEDWIDKAGNLYAKIGGTFVARPYMEFQFPSGAKIVCGHLAYEDSYERYKGQEFQRIIIDELTHIPSIELYMQVRACCRSAFPGLRPQMFLTSNPGGPGHGWVKDRFVRPRDPDTKEFVPPKTTIREKYTNPFTKKEGVITRIYIPSKLDDNPKFSGEDLTDDTYTGVLSTNDPKWQQAYLHGDWDTLVGVYFSGFRPEGPGEGEPANACHVLKTGEIENRNPKLQLAKPRKPWWALGMGGDWGFAHDAAFYWGTKDPDTKQIIVYRECFRERMTPIDIGVLIAQLSLDDLNSNPLHSLRLHFSHEAFNRTSFQEYGGVRSIVELLADGVSKVLGPNSVSVPQVQMPLNTGDDLGSLDSSYKQYLEDLRVQKKTGITIIRANTDRILGLTYIRQLLNWDPPITTDVEKIDWEYAQLLAREKGAPAYFEYVNRIEKAMMSDGLYPRLQIYDTCKKLIEKGIPGAVHDEKNPEDIPPKQHWDGRDELDALRYLCVGFGMEPDPPIPDEVKLQQHLDRYKQEHPGYNTSDLIWVNRHYEREQEIAKQKQHQGWSPGRAATRRRKRINMGDITKKLG